MTTIEAPAPPLSKPEPAPRRKRSRRGAGSYPVAARLARRELRRRPGRTALVALLIAVPVAGVVVAAAAAHSSNLTPAERWTQQFGQADVAVRGGVGLEVLPAGSRAVAVSIMRERLRTTDGRRATADVSVMPPRERLTDGMFAVLDGRAPRGPDEVLVAPAVAHDLGVGVGDVIELDRPVAARLTVTGTGLGANTTNLFGLTKRDGLVLAGPDSPLAAVPGNPLRGQLVELAPELSRTGLHSWLHGHQHLFDDQTVSGVRPDLWPLPDRGNEFALGPIATDAAVVGAWMVGAVTMTVLGIVIVAAFAAGNRRRLTTVGLLSANGAGPGAIRKMLGLEGVGVGLVGAVSGVVLGAIVTLAWGVRAGDDPFTTAPSPSDLWPADILPVVAFAVATATVAALLPGRSLSRVPTLTALAGRRPAGAVPRRVPVAGLFLAGAGVLAVGVAMAALRTTQFGSTAVAAVAVAGSVAVLAGMAVATPAWVGLLGALGGRLRGPWRLACRSLARRRGHSAAMVSAVLATAGLAVAGATGMAMSPSFESTDHMVMFGRPQDQAGFTARRGAESVALPPETVVEIPSRLPGSRVHALTALTPPPDSRLDTASTDGKIGSTWMNPRLVLADEAAIAAYRLDGDTRRRLQDAGAVTESTAEGQGVLVVGAPERTLLPVPVFARPADQAVRSGDVLVTEPRAAELGLARVPGETVVDLPGPITDEQRDIIDDIARDATGSLDDAGPPESLATVHVETFRPRPLGNDARALEAALVAAALAVTLLVVAAGAALSATESCEERDLLAVVGASPRTLRRTAARQVWVLVGLGCLLAVPTGWLPAVAAMTTSPGRVAVPWRMVGFVVLVLPMAAALVAGVGSAVTLRLRPVRPSTMATD